MDLNLNLTKNLQNGDIYVLNELQSIRASIKNLILTRKGERIFQCYLGTDLESLLFEVANSNTADNIIEQVKTLLNLYEPRITIDSVEVFLEDDDVTLSLKLVYTIVTSNTQDTFTSVLVKNR